MIRFFKRFNSTSSINEAKQWLGSLDPQKIPRNEFKITFSRSSGPGGQKVNKSDSKATIQLNDLDLAIWIPKEIKTQLKYNNFRYLTKTNGLVIQDDTQRSRELNTDRCFIKLVEEIRKTVYFENEASPEDKKRWESIRKVSNEKRIQEKKKNSEKRKLRKEKF
ncbi:Peptide chain release factor 1 [Wickerhamomyces ciferrii]|uniref:Peptide chain release factor 1 n=1 Tax=Wickerhamomyces ciferrii (strain ATCC 14091 / BCRC 22168 / CBS 111 / JCM 3599 / NBRC 0793 / NRRL Y-1031 F-60-10) TaxID=1206466 RepID=K0KN07_WICCF|nr:Peptide chain release factor 1 [Wickerhamomyces ciferrii]CCH43592.1 Peptide chain release factor 1 [Wickerhamomyces ciferrii]